MKFRSFFVGATTAAILASPAMADNTDETTVIVEGFVVAPISLDVLSEMDFPDIVAPSEGTAQISMDESGFGTYNPPTADPTPGNSDDDIGLPARFSASGAQDAQFTITANNEVFPDGVEFSANCPETGTVDVEFACGGVMTISSGFQGGVAGTFDLTVTYN